MTRTAAPPTRPPEPDGPRQVSKFEFNLLRILRFIFGHFPTDQGMQLIRSSLTRPECLSPAAVHLVQDTLAKATVLFLVREGGWRNDRYLRDNQPTTGRVWERIPLDERILGFSSHVLDFLVWLTTEKAHETQTPWDVPIKELTPADEFFFWRVFDSCTTDPDLIATFRSKDVFRSNPLCWLSLPGDLVEFDELEPPDFTLWFSGLRAVLLECLQPHLTTRWTRSERAKGQTGDWARMRQHGRAEFTALRAFLKAAEESRRTDLTRFVLKTNAALFQTELTPAFWTGGLQGSGPPRLADRLETQRAALAMPRQMEVLARWQQRALYVGYFDEDYQASQLWKQDWEAANGDRVTIRAHAAVEMIEPLRAPTSSQPPDGGAVTGDNPSSNPG